MTLTARERELVDRLIESKKVLDATELGSKEFNKQAAEVMDLTKQVNKMLADRGILHQTMIGDYKPSPGIQFFKAFRAVFAFFAICTITSISITSDIEFSLLFNRILLAISVAAYITYFFGYIYQKKTTSR